MQEKLIESCEASRVHRNISINDDDELEKRKESRSRAIRILAIGRRGQCTRGVYGQRSEMR